MRARQWAAMVALGATASGVACSSDTPGAPSSHDDGGADATAAGHDDGGGVEAAASSHDDGGADATAAGHDDGGGAEVATPGLDDGGGAEAAASACTPTCPVGNACVGGTCELGCFIDGMLYQPTALNPVDPCQSCENSLSTTAWTSAADGTSCGNQQQCAAGQCGTQCVIGGAVVASGAPNPNHACQSCEPGTNALGWTNVTGPKCTAPGEVCNQGSCAAGCFIDGGFYATSAANSANGCQTCEPDAGTSTWTVSADGTRCNGGTCCGGACASVGADPNNCAGCGDVCNAGPKPGCSLARCNYTLASNQNGPAGIAIDATSVYWTDPGSLLGLGTNIGRVMKAPLDGGAATTLASGLSGPLAIAVDATNVYWTNVGDGNTGVGTLMRVPLAGGTPPTTLVSGLTAPDSIALQAGTLFWTNRGGAPSTGSVMELPLDGGAVTTVASAQATPEGIAVNATGVYWTNNGTYDSATGSSTNGALMEAPLDGGPPTAMVSGQNQPWGIAMDATNVYWTSAGPTVMKTPLDGGASTTLVAKLSTDIPQAIAVDATNVYWGDSLGFVWLHPLGGDGGTTALYVGSEEPGGIALSATDVYFTSVSSQSAVIMVPK